jgi:hypothetical protein
MFLGAIDSSHFVFSPLLFVFEHRAHDFFTAAVSFLAAART